MTSRRAFLRGAGAALASPFLPFRRAAGQSLAPNLVLVTWPDGLEPGWAPTGEELGERLAALEPHRDRILVIHGLIGGIESELNAHREGPASLWTGSYAADGLARLPSIDHRLAATVGLGSVFPKLHFGVQSGRRGVLGNASPYYTFSGPEQPVPAEDDPEAMYRRIFSADPAGPSAAELELSVRRRASALDYVRARLSRLERSVEPEDRVRLQRHTEAIRAIERSLQRLREARCAIELDVPSFGGTAHRDADATFEPVAEIQADLLVSALACGLTKIATYQLSQTDSAVKLEGWAAPLHTVMHDHPRSERIVINRWFMGALAALLAKLEAVDAGAGRTLLDETLVVAASEMAIGNHGNDPLPVIVAGGDGRYFRTGRVLRLEGQPRHTRLLTSILHAMGEARVESVGDFEDERSLGALEEVRG